MAPVIVTAEIASALYQLGESDCERIRTGLLSQPVNAWSSFAYVVFGLWLVIRALRVRSVETPIEIAYGAALASIGVGSVAFHGPVPPGAQLMHDVTIAAALGVIAARGAGALRGWTPRQVLIASAAAIIAIGAVMAVAPAAGQVLAGVVGAGAVGSEVLLYRTGRRHLPSRVAGTLAATVGILGVAAVVNVLGRTGGPLCDPESVVQGHAVWHVLTAGSFMLYGYAAFPHSRVSPGAPDDPNPVRQR
jgi:hypothetical protein